MIAKDNMNEGHVITFLEELLFEIDNVVYIFLGTIMIHNYRKECLVCGMI
ncbi:MAG: hypothetical protein QXM58_02810 [Candidatus Micrarchaeaceae archaeon]